MHAKVVLNKTRNPSCPMDRATTYHLRHGTERTHLELFVSREPERSRIKRRIGPEIITVHVGKFVCAEVFLLQPRTTLQDHDMNTCLSQHPGCRRTGSSRPDNAYLGLVRFALVIPHTLLPFSALVPASAKNDREL